MGMVNAARWSRMPSWKKQPVSLGQGDHDQSKIRGHGDQDAEVWLQPHRRWPGQRYEEITFNTVYAGPEVTTQNGGRALPYGTDEAKVEGEGALGQGCLPRKEASVNRFNIDVPQISLNKGIPSSHLWTMTHQRFATVCAS